jgi:hypothetical protein
MNKKVLKELSIILKSELFFAIFLSTLFHLSVYTQTFLAIPNNNWTVKRLYFVEFHRTSLIRPRLVTYPFNWKKFLKMFYFICSFLSDLFPLFLL